MTAILKRGSRGDAVRELQRALGFTADDIDGIFGKDTEAAVRRFQKSHGLVTDGRVGQKTNEALYGTGASRVKRLSQSDVEQVAARLDVDVAAVMAVNEVESRGSGFLDDGRPVILFERHVMRRNLRDIGRDVGLLARHLPGIINRKPGGYDGGADEYERLNLAREIDEGCAIQAASWGLFQIMGHHFDSLGFESPQAMEAAASESEGAQLAMFAAFVEADPRLHRALHGHDWETFARIYNGPAYARHDYHGRMAAAFDNHREALRESA